MAMNTDTPFVPGGGAVSRMKLAGHAIHPMLIPFPIAFFSGALATDIAFLWFSDPFWAEMSYWLLAGGVTMGGLAALVGIADFSLVADIRRHLSAWNHFLMAIMLMALGLVNLLQRSADAAAVIWPWGLLLSLLSLVMLGITGWLGGKMVFEHNLGPDQPVRQHPGAEAEQDSGR